MKQLEQRTGRFNEIFESEYFKYSILFITLFFSSSIDIVSKIPVINSLKNLFFTLIPIILCYYMVKNRQVKKDINIIFMVLCGFSLISLIWSISLIDTLKSCILLIGTTVIGVYISKNYNKEELMKKLLTWFFIIVVINLILVFLKVSSVYQLDDNRYDNAIRGIFKHRNSLGLYMSIGISIALWFSLEYKDKRNRQIAGVVIAGGTFLIYSSKSMTSLILGVFITFLVFVTRYKKINIILCYSIIPIILISTYILIFTPEWFKDILQIMGRNSTLTGRSVIWAGVVTAIFYKPILGFGFGAFWTINPYSVLFVLSKYKTELPVNSHNGYLDLTLEFGLLGAVLIAIWIVIMIKKIIKLSREKEVKDYKYISYVMAYFIFLLIFNLVESSFMKPCNTSYILLIIFTNMLFGKYTGSISREGRI